jgi:hypothetical protein
LQFQGVATIPCSAGKQGIHPWEQGIADFDTIPLPLQTLPKEKLSLKSF